MKRFKGLMGMALAGAMLLATPAFAESHGHHEGHEGRGNFSRGSGGRGFERHDFDRHRDHDRDWDRHRGGWSFGVGVYPTPYVPYNYGYADPYYADPYYNNGAGYYDAYGNWIPNPNYAAPYGY